MGDEKPKLTISLEGFDPFGMKSASEISKEIIKLGVDSVREFLNLTCKPLLEELGLDAKDRYRSWKLLNTIATLEKARGKLKYDFEKEKVVIDPRVAFQIVEHASIISNETLQEMWAGLFAASCHTYEEDENIFFIDILKRLTSSQVKLINYLVEQSSKTINIKNLPVAREEGIVLPGIMKLGYDQIRDIMETKSTLKADSELIGLESMSLIEFFGDNQHDNPIHQRIKRSGYRGIRASLTAVLLYVKCQGSTESPFDYFLPDVTNYYFNVFKDYLNTAEKDILELVYKITQEGKSFENEISYSSQSLSINNIDWRSLPTEELTERLRKFLIYSNFTTLDNTYIINIDKQKFAQFNYHSGIIKD